MSSGASHPDVVQLGSRRLPTLAAVALLACLHALGARAQVGELPRSLVTAALDAHKATAFAPSELDALDFALERAPGSSERVEAAIEAGSLRWVRVATYVRVPRGVLRVRVRNARSGVVTYAGTTQALAKHGEDLVADVPVALLSGRQHPIAVRAFDGAHTLDASYFVRFSPRAAMQRSVMLDSSCSPFSIAVNTERMLSDSFLHLGCRLIRTAHRDVTGATLEVYALFDHPRSVGLPARMLVDGIEQTAAVDSLIVLRLSHDTPKVRLTAGASSVLIAQRSPPKLPTIFVGAGLGPYLYTLEDGPIETERLVPLITLYAGYTFTPDVRIVYFNATALHERGYADNGLYLWIEQARMVDDRLSFNLLLGANILVYSHRDQVEWRFTAPQGFELIYRDIFGRNRNATLGAFLYPEIFNRSYYNVWLRWGSPQLFGELNFIHWKQDHDDYPTSSSSFGVSFGTPILFFD